MSIINVTVYNFFVPSQTISTNIKAESINDRLVFIESWHSSPIPCNVNDRLWFHEVAVVQKAIYNLSTSNFLTMIQETQPRQFVEALWTPMTLVSVAYAVNTKGVRNDLLLTQQVSYEICPNNLVDSLTITETISYNIIKVQQIEHILLVTDGASSYKPEKVI